MNSSSPASRPASVSAIIGRLLLLALAVSCLTRGLNSIDLDYRESRRRDEHGNWFRYRAKVKDTRGAQLGRWAWDVFLVAAP